MKETKIYGSLARRVGVVFLVMVVSPLLLYVGVLWAHDWKVKLKDAFSEMELLGKFSVSLSILPPEDRDKSVNSIHSLSTVLTLNQKGVCTYSNRKELLGQKEFYTKIVPKTLQLGSFLFIEQNPATKKKELFLFERQGEEIWGLSVDLEKWTNIFSRMEDIGYPMRVSFLPPKENNFIQLHLSELKEWQKKAGLFEGIKMRGKNLALMLTVPNADFDIFVILTSKEINQYAGGIFFSHILSLMGLLTLFGGIGTIWITRRMARPFHQLYQVMESIREEDYSKKYIEDRFGFDINVLGRNFNQMLEALLTNMRIAEEERVSRELLTKELEVGRSIQNQLLPKTLPEFPGLAIGSGFVPAREVAGDFYDLFARGENELLLTIADGSDKGVSACLYSLMVRSLLRSHALVAKDLENIVLQTNNLFCKDTGDTGNFVTAFMAIYYGDTHILQYTSAGHLPGIFIDSEGELQELTTEGIALGVTEIEHIEVKSIPFSPGSLLFLYSDGVTEAHNKKGELFGKSRLIQFLSTHHDLEPQKLIDQLLKEIDNFARDSIQHDDLTIVCIKVH
jgi:serine phosphatase RsbU (regulator of sigma subunit)